MVIDPLYPFVFALMFSPGPNVIMLTASGARFGFRATLPHILGVACGVGVTSSVTSLGMGAVLDNLPGLTRVLQIVAAAWILWMAWTLLTAARAEQRAAGDTPWRFHQAALFQWVNPKVWAIALAATAGYASDLPPMWEAARIGSSFVGLNLSVGLFWTFAGTLLTFLLTTPLAWRIFNGAMAMLLAASAVMVFW